MTKISILIILVGITLSPIQTAQEISDAQKKEFIELLNTLPTKGEFYTEEAARRAAPYLPVLFSLTEKEVPREAIYAFAAISAGISEDKERRAYAVSHFAEIRHPLLKLYWAVRLFNLTEASPEIVRYLRDALNSEAQAREMKSMIGPEFKFFKRTVEKHPFAQDGTQRNPVFEDEEGHADWVESVAFSPDNKTLLSGSHDGTMILWDVVTSKPLRLIEGHRDDDVTATINSVAFSPDGKMLVSAATDMTVRFWNAASGAELRAYHGIEHYPQSVVFSPDGKMVAAANCGDIVFLDALTGKSLRTIRKTIGCFEHVAFSPDGRTLLSDGDLIEIRDVVTGRLVKSFRKNTSPTSGMALSPDGKTILLGGEKGPELWSVESSRLLLRFPEQPQPVETVAFSPDGKTIAFESQEGRDPFAPGIINVWDISTGKELRRMVGHQSRVSSLVFSADGKLLASGSWDKTVKLWDVSSGQQIRNFPAEKK